MFALKVAFQVETLQGSGRNLFFFSILFYYVQCVDLLMIFLKTMRCAHLYTYTYIFDVILTVHRR